MDILWLRLLRFYRKHPIAGFVATVGLVDAIMGGLSQRWSLLSIGLSTTGVAIALYFWQFQRRKPLQPSRSSVYILPPESSRSSLPSLNTSQSNTSRR